MRHPPSSTLFPYTTLFRSRRWKAKLVATLKWSGRPRVLDLACGTGDIAFAAAAKGGREGDRKSTRLNSSHSQISYAVFCLKKKNTTKPSTSPQFLHACVPR